MTFVVVLLRGYDVLFNLEDLRTQSAIPAEWPICFPDPALLRKPLMFFELAPNSWAWHV